jgi:Helix-turn-helix family
MDYDEALGVFYATRPPDTPVPEAVSGAGPARRLRDAAEPVAMHAVWSRLVNERLAGLGLDFLTGYVAGRGGPLGDAAPAVVAAAFAWFDPPLIESLWTAARSQASLAEVLRVRTQAVAESLEPIVGDEDEVVDEAAAALRRAVEPADGTGRPLFSALRAQPWPGTPAGRLHRACDLVREHRGDSHVAAAVAAGMGPVEMSVLTELWLGMPLGSYSATRGFADPVIQAAAGHLADGGLVEGATLTERGRALRAGIEARTDAMEQPIVDALGPALDGLVERLDRWSAACIAAGAFPPDPLKRAAG